ncbi:hypothetical protein QF004_001639 [Chryseobacterium sp. MDT2-18]|nr:hypothetical protein [Chryseobacterium sp. MDT2-18]
MYHLALCSAGPQVVLSARQETEQFLISIMNK